MKILGIVILLLFYSIYLGKMFLQKQKGIQTDQIARGKQKDKVFYTELVLKIATYSVILVEVISIFTVPSQLPQSMIVKSMIVTGIILGFLGDIIFGLAVITMKDSWRAGIAEDDKTEIVTVGIYKISRNPAFLGFDCVYLGILLMFFNWVLLLFSIFAIIMLHLQILQEEKYLPNVFGEEYIKYKSAVCRYFGRKPAKYRTIIKTSIFPASEKEVFSKLKELRTLQYIAAPYATFIPVNGNDSITWNEGETFSFRFKLFSVLPFGIHTIKVIDFSEETHCIYTHESNTHIPVWNHCILLKQVRDNEVEYTDKVEIYAGWKTPFVCLWASSFYAHRQKKWLRLLKDTVK